MTSAATGAGRRPRLATDPAPSKLLLALGAAALLAAPLAMLAGEGTGSLLLAAPLVVVLGLLGVHRPAWAVAAVPATAVIGLREVGAGVQVVQVLTAAVIGCVLVHLLATRRRPPLGAPLLWGSALLLVALASTAISERVVLGLKVDAGLALGVLVAACVVATCRRERDLRTVLRAAALGSLVVTLPVLLQLGDLRGVYGGAAVSGRPVGVFVQPNELGSYAVTSVWSALALAALARRRADRVLGLVAAAAAAAAMVFSLSRGSWLGLAVGVLVLVVLHPPVLRAVVAAGLAVSVCLGVAVAVAPTAAPAAVVLERVSTLGSGASNPEDRRDLVRQEAVRLMASAPVLGHGPGSFAPEAAGWESLISQYRRFHAHNVVLHVGAETGLVGVGALLGLTTAVATTTVRSSRSHRRAGRPRNALAVALLASGCVSFAAHGMVDVTFQNPLVMVMTWLLLGSLLAAAAVRPDTDASLPVPAAGVVAAP